MLPGETTGTIQGTKQGTAGQGNPPLNDGTASDGNSGSTSQPETFTREQLQKFVSDALTDQGRKHKTELEPVIRERDTLKSQLQEKETELTGITEERENLQKQIEELASGDPKKFDLIKKDRELRDRERKLKADAQTLEQSKQAHAERVKLADETLREISVWEIATEYEGGDATKLKGLVDTFGATSEEQIRKVAETLWAKKGATPGASALKPYSGMTTGGTENYDNLKPEEKISKGLELARKKQGR